MLWNPKFITDLVSTNALKSPWNIATFLFVLFLVFLKEERQRALLCGCNESLFSTLQRLSLSLERDLHPFPPLHPKSKAEVNVSRSLVLNWVSSVPVEPAQAPAFLFWLGLCHFLLLELRNLHFPTFLPLLSFGDFSAELLFFPTVCSTTFSLVWGQNMTQLLLQSILLRSNETILTDF